MQRVLYIYLIKSQPLQFDNQTKPYLDFMINCAILNTASVNVASENDYLGDLFNAAITLGPCSVHVALMRHSLLFKTSQFSSHFTSISYSLSFFSSLSFSHFPYHYSVSRMCGVWCSSCFLSPGLLIGVTAFTGTLVYCVSVKEQRLDELQAFR